MRHTLLVAVFLGAYATCASAQVIFRNDFVINRRQHKLENKGITFISINLDNRPNWNQLINGRGGRTLVIDVRAIRPPRRHLTYGELAEKVYLPPTNNSLAPAKVPLFLLTAPPVSIKKNPVAFRSHRINL